MSSLPTLAPEAGIIPRLLRNPQRVEFFQAVRMLELWYARAGERGRAVVAEKLRFTNSLSLAFPASEIEALQVKGAPAGSKAVPDAQAVAQVRLTPAFIGLTGRQGALPYYYTERIAQQEQQSREGGARAFLDIFSNRSTALFYAAWKKYRLALQAELDRSERFLPLVLALSGLGFRALRGRHEAGEGQVYDEALAHYAAALRQRPVSAALMQQVLSHYFALPIRLEQFVGRWCAVPAEQRSLLGQRNARLGASALAGSRVWQRDLRVRLWVGPLARREFDAFLPGGERAQALKKLLSLFTGVTLEYEVRLLLLPEAVRGARLGGTASAAPRLGWDSFVATRPAAAPRADVAYLIHALP